MCVVGCATVRAAAGVDAGGLQYEGSVAAQLRCRAPWCCVKLADSRTQGIPPGWPASRQLRVLSGVQEQVSCQSLLLAALVAHETPSPRVLVGIPVAP